VSRCLIGLTVVAVLLLVGSACASSEQEQDQGAGQTTNEETPTAEETGSDLTELLNDPAYKTVTDGIGALSVEVPSGWEVMTGEDSEARSSWSSFGDENVGSSITASTDLDTWHNTSGVPGVYVVASRDLAQRYTDDELVVSGPNDFSISCERGSRRDFDRHSYSGRMQAWKNCAGNGEEADLVTLAAAPEGRACVVVLQIGMYGEADVEAGQRILDTFEADCRLLSSSTTESTPGSSPKTTPEADSAPTAMGVLERPEVTTYMYGTHAIIDETSGTMYALRSEDEGLLDGYVGQRVTVHGTLVAGYENGQVEGGPPLMNVTRVESA
jgi:hypothetical protein